MHIFQWNSTTGGRRGAARRGGEWGLGCWGTPVVLSAAIRPHIIAPVIYTRYNFPVVMVPELKLQYLNFLRSYLLKFSWGWLSDGTQHCIMSNTLDPKRLRTIKIWSTEQRWVLCENIFPLINVIQSVFACESTNMRIRAQLLL